MSSDTDSANIVENRVYDELGNLTIVFTTAESVFTYTYDTDGKLISETQDFDGDSSIDSVTIANYKYDSFGNLTIDYATDSNGDTQADRVLSYTFNPQGEQIGTYDSLSDSNPGSSNPGSSDPGSSDPNIFNPNIFIRDSIADEEGLTLVYVADSDFDGQPESIVTYSLDRQGNVIGFGSEPSQDSNNSGTFLRGTLLNSEGPTFIYVTDNNFDAQPEQVTTYSYNLQGNLISITRDLNGDEIHDSVITVSYKSDEFGNLTIDYATDSNLDAQADRVLSYTFNPQGKQIGTYDSFLSPIPDDEAPADTIEPPAIIQPLSLEVDTSGIIFVRTTYTLKGKQASFSLSNSGLSSSGTLKYDEFDNIIEQGVGRGFSFQYSNIYDSNNNLIRILETPPGFPSSLDPYLTREFEYGGNNNLIKQIEYNQIISNSLFDPTIIAAFEAPLYGEIVTSEFDADGNLTRSLIDNQGLPFDPQAPFREAADGIPDTIRVFAYGTNGNLLEESVDNEADGTIDRLKALYAYDNQNREIKANIDTNDDGILDYERVSAYLLDAENNLTREITTQESSGVENIYTFSYDDNGNPTMRTLNGQDVGSQQNFYDEFDNLTRTEGGPIGASTALFAVRLVGSDGRNVLTGTERDDILNGGGGRDRIEGRGGRDRLIGGAGIDTFVISAARGSNDTIFDFSTEDILELSEGLSFNDLIFEGSSISILDESTPGFPFNRAIVELKDFNTATLTAEQFVFT